MPKPWENPHCKVHKIFFDTSLADVVASDDQRDASRAAEADVLFIMNSMEAVDISVITKNHPSQNRYGLEVTEARLYSKQSKSVFECNWPDLVFSMMDFNFPDIPFYKKMESVSAVHGADRTEVVFPPNFPAENQLALTWLCGIQSRPSSIGRR